MVDKWNILIMLITFEIGLHLLEVTVDIMQWMT